MLGEEIIMQEPEENHTPTKLSKPVSRSIQVVLSVLVSEWRDNKKDKNNDENLI